MRERPAGQTARVDPQKVQSALRHMSREHLAILFARALEIMPPRSLRRVVRDYVRVDTLLSSDPPMSLLDQVRQFHARALRREFYEDFAVNWRNSNDTSKGTDAFVAEFRRLLDACGRASRRRPRAEARAGFELMFELLGLIDEGKELVFFADEAGSFQVNHYWDEALPAYFRCLADEAEPGEFAERALSVIRAFTGDTAPKFFALAQRAARREQRAAFRELAAERSGVGESRA